VIDFKQARVYDYSGVEAIQNIAKRYEKQGKQLHLLNLSKECQTLIGPLNNVVEVSIIKDLNWHLAVDKLS
ncbi:MAG: STAS domain-containing protein, partial [Candidatus Margulisiibacteriota bacterium]|nr:STAS domain-containing protein [Candidatus Margulisiibacteriota bacterium]